MSYLQQMVLVGAGGMLGSVSRFITGGLTARWSLVAGFPIGTLVVNCVGCFLIGWISAAGSGPSDEKRLFVQIGLLGGFTTFSAFGLESMVLLREGLYGRALLNVVLQVILGLGAAALGLNIAKTS